MKTSTHPPAIAATGVVVTLVAVWCYLRVALFPDELDLMPVTFVLPLFVCVWTRRRSHLWFMSAAFTLMAGWKVWATPGQTGLHQNLFLGATIFNIVVGAAIVHLILRYRDRIEQRNSTIAAQNQELESQSEELLQQNEEIRAQTEELTQQNEEIEAQSEELTRRNDELTATNSRLVAREELLQGLLQCSRTSGSGDHLLRDLCTRGLRLLNESAEVIAILEHQADFLQLRVHVSREGDIAVPSRWPVQNSLPQLVITKDSTAYVSDLAAEPALAEPFAASPAVRSLFATPLHIEGQARGALVVCGRQATHWNEEQFRLLEWLAAQCSLIGEALRWQHAHDAHVREVVSSNRAKSQFLAMLSHELRTPLTPVLAASGMLESDPRIPSDVREDLAMIRRNIAIQGRLIDDLLDLTRIECGKLDLNRQILNLPALLRDAVTIVAADVEAKEQRLELRCDVPEDCNVVADGARLQQVLWNLLKNAVKFSPVQSRIVFTAKLQAGDNPRAIISVADSGPGIASTDFQRIFLPFEQADAPRRRTTPGLGLGLAIAKAIIEVHGGRIDVASPGEGRGSCFTIELPLSLATDVPADGDAAAAPGHASRLTTQQSLRILLVEDHADTGRIITRLLKHSGHAVEHAMDAANALILFARRHFDLVISDLGLPDESGLVLMQKLRALRADVPAICMSGYGAESDRQACEMAGFREHLTKPVDMQQLHAAISRATNRRTTPRC
jgi:signal transduction histidine kinase/ActR/RegA family two-component response regulator